MLRDQETNDFVQLIGDPYAKKKDAEHSAALQGLSYVQRLGPGGGGIGISESEPAGTDTKAAPKQMIKMPKKSETAVAELQNPDTSLDELTAGTKAIPLPSSTQGPDRSAIVVSVPKLLESSSPDFPCDTSIVDTLRRVNPQPLKLRELYLTALGRNPKTDQMGSGVKKSFNRKLYALKASGTIKGAGPGMWTLA